MPEVLRTVGRYEIIREIGRGGMAVVYLARQTDLDRYVAMKELAALHAADKSFAQRFLRESRMAGSLSHPNIVTVHDYLEWEGTPFIAMEYLERGSLRPYVGGLTDAQAVGILEGLLAGLTAAEGHGIVHRDLKPENIMITQDGRIKIADFGIAKASGTATAMLTATGTTVGTPSYMAPEQAMARNIGPWTDLYSTGCMAFELFCGRVPFISTETPMAILMKHVNEPPPPPRSLRQDLDPRLSEWIESLLAKTPAERPASAAEAWDQLEEIVLDTIGPRWRREARLPFAVSGANTPKPLTPAPFKSSAALQATPEPSEAVEAPEAESEFMTFNAPAPGPPTPEAAAPPPPAAAPPPPAPEQQAPPPPAPAPPPPAQEAPPPEPAPPPPPPPAPEPVQEAPPEPAPPPTPPVPPPVERTEAQPVDARPLPGDTVPPAPAAPPPKAEPTPPPAPPPPPKEEPKAEPTPEPVAAKAAADPDLTVAPSSVPAPKAPEKKAKTKPKAAPKAKPKAAPADQDTIQKRRWVAGIGAGALLAVVAGFVIGGSGSKEAAEAPPVASQAISSSAVSMRVPQTYGHLDAAPAVPGLELTDSVAAAPSGAPEGAGIAAGLAKATGSTLLPADLLAALPEEPEAEAVKLGNVQALRYTGLQPGGETSLTAYVVPTDKGVATLACTYPGSAPAAFNEDCEAAALSLKLAGETKVFPLGPNEEYAAAASEVLTALNKQRASLRGDLADAKTRPGQARLAGELGSAYAKAETALREVPVGPNEAAAHYAIVRSLAGTEEAYKDLSAAARRNRRADYARHTRAVTRAETALAEAVAGLEAAGYKPS